MLGALLLETLDMVSSIAAGHYGKSLFATEENILLAGLYGEFLWKRALFMKLFFFFVFFVPTGLLCKKLTRHWVLASWIWVYEILILAPIVMNNFGIAFAGFLAGKGL